MQDKSIDSVEPDIPEVVWKKKKEEKFIKQSFINTLFITCKANPETPAFTWFIKFCYMWCNEQLSISSCYSRTSANGHFCRPGGQKIHTLTLV